jgi:hypothetical protein
MEDLVDRMDRAAGTVRPNLAVRFAADPNVPLANRHGVLQYGCTFVGECVIGCNQGAKNSLDYNYLAVAERAGAVALTAAEVLRIGPSDDGYRVTYRNHAEGGGHHAAAFGIQRCPRPSDQGQGKVLSTSRDRSSNSVVATAPAEPFLRDRSHPIAISGTIDIEGLATASPVTGTLELFPDAGDVAMRYHLKGSNDEGETLVLVAPSINTA